MKLKIYNKTVYTWKIDESSINFFLLFFFLYPVGDRYEYSALNMVSGIEQSNACSYRRFM